MHEHHEGGHYGMVRDATLRWPYLRRFASLPRSHLVVQQYIQADPNPNAPEYAQRNEDGGTECAKNFTLHTRIALPEAWPMNS
jgi:hypothetical protein